jgi:hypothetical protein
MRWTRELERRSTRAGPTSTWTHFSGLALSDGQVYTVDQQSRVYCFGLRKKGI